MSHHRVAVMQPYFLPYLGYWQLLATVDELIVYDTVQYSSGGWINRNRIRSGGEIRWVTVPLERAPHRTPIQHRRITSDDRWRPAMLRQVGAAYRTAPARSQGLDVLERTLARTNADLTAFLMHSMALVAQELGIATGIRRASELPPAPPGTSADDRVIRICRHLGASDYFNLSGGVGLYHADRFATAGVALHFHVPPAPPPEGTEARDDQTLSVLDLLMRRDADEVASLVSASRWVSPEPSAAATGGRSPRTTIGDRQPC